MMREIYAMLKKNIYVCEDRWKKVKKKENELPSSILSSFSWETWAFCKATIFSYIRKKTVDFVHDAT